MDPQPHLTQNLKGEQVPIELVLIGNQLIVYASHSKDQALILDLDNSDA